MTRNRVDDILEEACGDTVARMVSGLYRMAEMLARVQVVEGPPSQDAQAPIAGEADAATESEVSGDGAG